MVLKSLSVLLAAFALSAMPFNPALAQPADPNAAADPAEDDDAGNGYGCDDIELVAPETSGCMLAARVLGVSFKRVEDMLENIGTPKAMKALNKRINAAARRFIVSSFPYREDATRDAVYGKKSRDPEESDIAVKTPAEMGEFLVTDAKLFDTGRANGGYSSGTASKAKPPAPAPAPVPVSSLSAPAPAPCALPAPASSATRTGGTVP